MSDGLPPVRIEIPADEWEVFRGGLVWAIRHSYVDPVTIRYVASIDASFAAADKGRTKKTKTPAVLALSRETLVWVQMALVRALRSSRAKTNYFEMRTTLERRAFTRNAETAIARLESESKKTFIDLIGDLG